ncbi:hypothetical protein P3T27_003263 [Kitasatospora sp. MAA19]|uniref:hypothetical protein n=1 Tax=Kitasatospora sp. MAA19 TaxID=3035090 RepID=UPI0024760FC7|nr:hypothetical protein [Kitasatospora sp. MAA19]MDH6706536.1 hypothetical protein [Kitasatospora sp. MAA19]
MLVDHVAIIGGRRAALEARNIQLARALQEHVTEAERSTVLAALALIDRLNRR